MFTTGPGSYKIPSSSDVPVEFNVSLLDRAPNPKAIFSSKVRLKGLTHKDNKFFHMICRTDTYSSLIYRSVDTFLIRTVFYVYT